MAKIGIMSFAHLHGDFYAGCVVANPDAELTAVWDDNVQRGQDAAQRYGTAFIEDMDEFLKQGLDGVIITSENMKHRQMVEKAAEAGLWILCEKPLSPTVEDCQAMVDVCKKAGVGLGIPYPCRHVPALKEVKKQIDSGALGKIFAVSCTNNGQFPGGWFGDESLSGGGATMDHTVHVADLLRWYTGKEFTKVYCENGNLLRSGLGTDDIGVMHMEMEGGIAISHIASWSRVDSFPTWGDVTLEIVAENGVIEVDAFNQKVDVYNDDDVKAQWVGWGMDPNGGIVADFVASIAEKRDPIATGMDGLKSVAVTVAAYKSARTTEMVEV
ncbi:MAG: Gfo/Idh/MocA family protein, partial [Candidatus Hydrogenedentota bacterium]